MLFTVNLVDRCRVTGCPEIKVLAHAASRRMVPASTAAMQ